MLCSAEILVDTRVAIEPKKASHRSLRFVSLLVCLLCQLLWKTRCARRTVDQPDGIYNSYSTVARDLWQRKPPLSSGCALGLGSVYCHKSLAPCYNYNVQQSLHMHGHINHEYLSQWVLSKYLSVWYYLTLRINFAHLHSLLDKALNYYHNLWF